MISTLLDRLRTLIIRDDSGLAPTDVVLLGLVAGRLEHLEQMLRHEQSKYRVRDTRKSEWPVAGDEIHVWRHDEWQARTFTTSRSMPGELWLPAPPPPEDS